MIAMAMVTPRRNQSCSTGFGEGNTRLLGQRAVVGLDNMIYAANGRSNGQVRSPDDPPGKAVSIGLRDLRFPPGCAGGNNNARSDEHRGHRRFQSVRTGARRFGGNRFPSWNTIRYRHVVLEQPSLDRNPYLAETSCIASILSDMTDGGRIFSISPAQAKIQSRVGGVFQRELRSDHRTRRLAAGCVSRNVFVCEPLSNLVHRRVLEPDGVTFVARRVEQGKEFLASSDPAFRPVNLATGPDGALYIVDMYRELVERPWFAPGVRYVVLSSSVAGMIAGEFGESVPRSGAIAGGRKPRLSPCRHGPT